MNISINIIGVNVQEENLMNMLFGRESQYNALITPIPNSSEPLDVYFGLTLAQIINVYEKEQIVKVNVWLQLRWYDYQMKWNPDRFGLFE
jgi:nicotinic acetylcholine receptor